MDNFLKDKKMLILGASSSEISLVRRAQEKGIYVIVTDYNTNYTISPAKRIADEAWDVSWSDIDKLENLCREVGVNGVIAGYSEFRVENMIKLCDRLGLPCYCNYDQLEITRHKRKFKNCCKKYGIPTIKEYAKTSEVDSYPVIVKPVDRAGSIGISIAKNEGELIKAYEYALEMSVSKEVIIEEYITEATKFDAYYEIIDGEVIFVSSDDVINSKKNHQTKVLQSGWILPSIHQERYIADIDKKMKELIRGIGITNGYIFFSGFVNKDQEFSFFECGFRLCGGHLYNYFPLIGAYNNLDIFIEHSLTGTTKNLKRSKKNDSDLKCLTINYYAKKGKISKIEGFGEILSSKDCKLSLQQTYEGKECEDNTAILSKIGMVYFCNESIDNLLMDLEVCNRIISVTDSKGDDLVFDRMTGREVRDVMRGGRYEL